MIPILYEATEITFTSNGLGRLSDAISLTVYEERNGRFDLEMQYPVTGTHFEDIQEGRIIAATHDENGDLQPFIIYSSSKPLNGIVTFNAYHYSYRLNDAVVNATPLHYPRTAQGLMVYAAGNATTAGSAIAQSFTYLSDITDVKSGRTIENPLSFRAFLGGSEKSVLQTYGGEFEWDKRTVNLWQARGSNKGVTIRYGKNLADFKAEVDYSGAYTHVYALYMGDDLDQKNDRVHYVSDSGHRLPGNLYAYRVVDFSSDIESGETKTAAQIETELQALGASYASANKIWEPAVSIEVDFVQLWQTEEYKDYAPLLTCSLCDTVTVHFGKYGLSDLAIKIVAVEWDALNDRYQKMTLGGLATTLAESINTGVSGSVQANADAIQNLNTRGGISDVTQNGTSVVTGSVAAVTVPTKTSDLTNDSGFITTPTVHSATVSSAYSGSCNYIKLGRMVIFDANITTTGALTNGTVLASGLPANHYTATMAYGFNNNSTTENVAVYMTSSGTLTVRGAFSAANRSIRVSGAYISAS